MTGSWEEIEIIQAAKDAVNFIFSQIHKDAKLKSILNAKKQIVNGTNYDLTLELKKGEIQNGMVYKTLKGDYSISKEFKQTKYKTIAKIVHK